MTAVLDSSALIALALGERGGDTVAAHARNAAISAVNITEVLQRLEEEGIGSEDALNLLGRLEVEIVPFTLDQARIAAELRRPTKHRGLSLGDRACLALTRERGSVVLTSDTAWDGLDVGIEIQLIR